MLVIEFVFIIDFMLIIDSRCIHTCSFFIKSVLCIYNKFHAHNNNNMFIRDFICIIDFLFIMEFWLRIFFSIVLLL